MRDPALVQVEGPLAPFAEGFCSWLERSGYGPQSRVGHLRLMVQLSSWLGERGLDEATLSSEVVDEFVVDRRAGGHPDLRSTRALRPLLEYLREVGAAAASTQQQVDGPVEEQVLADYASYLAHERGLAVGTIQRSTDLIRPFLATRVAGDVLGLASLTAAEVTAFMLTCSEDASPATVQCTGTALRSLLRFLRLRGMVGTSLVGAVPTGWRSI